MLAEMFMLRLETAVRVAAKEAASRFIPIKKGALKDLMSRAPGREGPLSLEGGR